MGAMDIVINAVDNASNVIKGIAKEAESSGDKFNSSFNLATLAISGTGVALEALAQSQKPLTDEIGKLSIVLGESEEALRDLALETTNVTFPLEDVVSLMKTGSEVGLRTSEDLQTFATYWDMVGDAVGGSGPALGEASVALQVLGIEADNVAESSTALGYIFGETTSSVEDFLTFIQRSADELQYLGLDLNETAALMGALEQETGLTGRVLRTEFRESLSEVQTEMQNLERDSHKASDAIERFDGLIRRTESDNRVLAKEAENLAARKRDLVTQLNAIDMSSNTEDLDRNRDAYMRLQDQIRNVELQQLRVSERIQLNNADLDDYNGKIIEAEDVMKAYEDSLNGNSGALDILLDKMGVSREAFDEQVEKVGDYEGVIEDLANRHAETYTSMDDLKQKGEELAFQFGNLIQAGGDLSLLFIAGGPLLQGLSALRGGQILATGTTIAQSVATWSLNAALAVLTSPITLVIAAIAALIGIGVLLVKNWDTVEEVAGKVFGGIGDFISGVIGGIGDAINWLGENWDLVWEGMAKGVKAPVNLIIDMINLLLRGINNISFKMPDWVPGYGGNEIGFNIKEIPRLHQGGVFRAPKPGGEGLALLKDRERVTAPGGYMSSLGGSGGRPIEAVINVDGRTLMRALLPYLASENVKRSGV